MGRGQAATVVVLGFAGAISKPLAALRENRGPLTFANVPDFFTAATLGSPLQEIIC